MAEIDLESNNSRVSSIDLNEIGGEGIMEYDGHIYEQVKEELRYPEVLDTYKLMYNDPLIFAALNLTTNMMAKVNWYVKEAPGATQEQKDQAEFIRQCMKDIEGQTWQEFIKNVLDMLIFGFSVFEKVFRRRKRSNGSKYNDNLVGWRKLAHRSQRTIRKWKFSEDGRKLLGLYQDLSKVTGNDRYNTLMDSPQYEADGLFIKRDKFMLFRNGSRNDNPEGHSPLAACWVPWRYKTTIEEHECIGVSRDLRGMPVIELHPQFMSADATESQKRTYEEAKRIIRNINAGRQSGLVIPAMMDEHGNPIFKFSLVGVQGNKAHDTDKIIKRYEDKILTALFADILKLGHNTHGSFSLAGAKTNITAINIEARLQEIADVINNDLIPHTFRLNGWDTANTPTIEFEDLDEEDLDTFSKMIQRMGSVNYIPRTKGFVAQALKRAGFDGWEDILEMDDETFSEMFTDNEISAGEGMQEGDPSGTGNPTGSASENNSENAS